MSHHLALVQPALLWHFLQSNIDPPTGLHCAHGCRRPAYGCTVNRTVSVTSGSSGRWAQSARTAMTLCVPAASPRTTNSVCPLPRWTIPVTPAGIVSLGGVSVRSMNKWWCAVPDRSSLAGAISTPAAASTTRTSGPVTTAPSTGSTISTRAGRSARAHASAARAAPVKRTRRRTFLGSHPPITINCYGPAVQCWSKAVLRCAATASGGRPSMSDRSSMYMSRPSLKSAICGDEGG